MIQKFDEFVEEGKYADLGAKVGGKIDAAIEKVNNFKLRISKLKTKTKNFVEDKIDVYNGTIAQSISMFVTCSILLHMVREKLGIKDNWVSALGKFFAGDIDFGYVAEDSELVDIAERLSRDEEIIELAKNPETEDFTRKFGNAVFNKLSEEDIENITAILADMFTINI